MKKFYINQIKNFIYNNEIFYEHENEIETFNEINTKLKLFYYMMMKFLFFAILYILL